MIGQLPMRSDAEAAGRAYDVQINIHQIRIVILVAAAYVFTAGGGARRQVDGDTTCPM